MLLHDNTPQVAADPEQHYWDLGLKCFNDGDPATTAMQVIWDAMLPPTSLPLLATIVGAIYGDTYWNQTKMDADRLATQLQAALGINPADCQKAASIAFKKWCGLLVRANMGDAGAIPKSDPVTASPDVVVNGQAPLTVKQLVEKWNFFIWDSQPGLKNYAYGRAQSINIKVPITTAVLRMYYSDAGFNPPPSSWVKMYTYTGSQETSPMQTTAAETGKVGVGERAANSDAFGFQPPGTGHYCLIAVAGSEYFTNNPSDNPGGNWNTQEWIHNNGAAGWHNVDVITGNEGGLKFYNQDGVSEQFIFEAHCHKLPKGTIVSLECNDTGLTHAIKANPTAITKPAQIVGTVADVPPNFAGNLTLRVKTPDGKPLPAGSDIDVRMDWVIPANHRHYAQAIDQLGDTQALRGSQPVRIHMGNFTFVGAA